MEKKFFRSIIAPIIKGVDCSDAWKFVARHFENGSYPIKGIYLYHYYSPVVHTDSFIINIDIADIHRLTDIILDISNAFQNKKFPVH